mgnify:CR=1 FL=1
MRDSILLILLCSYTPLTARDIATRLEADAGDVAKQCSAMLGKGLIFVDGDRRFGTSLDPMWALTTAGEHVAREVKAARNAAALLGTEKPVEVE